MCLCIKLSVRLTRQRRIMWQPWVSSGPRATVDRVAVQVGCVGAVDPRPTPRRIGVVARCAHPRIRVATESKRERQQVCPGGGRVRHLPRTQHGESRQGDTREEHKGRHSTPHNVPRLIEGATDGRRSKSPPMQRACLDVNIWASGAFGVQANFALVKVYFVE